METNRHKYYSKLPVEVQKKFMNNLIARRGPAFSTRYMDHTCAENLHEFISNAFGWVDTEEGPGYWVHAAHHPIDAEPMNETTKLSQEYRSVSSITQQVIMDLKRELEQAHETIRQQQVAYESKRPSERERSWEFVKQRMVLYTPHKSYLLTKAEDVFDWLYKNYYPPTPLPRNEAN